MYKFQAGLLCILLLFIFSNANGQLAPRQNPSILNQNKAIGSRSQPLLPEQAFPYYVSIVAPGRLRVTWQISSEHYLYRHRFHFTLVDPDSGEQNAVDYQLPAGKPITDEFFGAVEVYYDTVSADLVLEQQPGPTDYLLIEYQGCAEWGFCYPPESDEFRLGL